MLISDSYYRCDGNYCLQFRLDFLIFFEFSCRVALSPAPLREKEAVNYKNPHVIVIYYLHNNTSNP